MAGRSRADDGPVAGRDLIATEMAYRINTYTLPFRVAWYKYVKGVESSGGEVWYPNNVWLDK